VYVRNAWYVTAWSTEVSRQPIRRTVCEIPVTLFRKRDGSPAALEDRCSHRGYPLSAGQLVDDAIECGYHGFQFDCSGMCVRIPAQEIIPPRTTVRSFPLVEKDGWIWIWTGDPARADAAKVPDTHWMTDPAWATVTHSFPFACRAELIHDNLLDLTHESFIHLTTVGDDYIYKHPLTVEVDGDVVSADRLMPGVEAPPLYAATMGLTGLWDRFHCTEFHAPSFHALHSGITGQGRPREEGYLIKVMNGITPIDAHTSHYYYAFSRNFGVDDSAATEALVEGLRTVLQEDADAMALQEIGLQTRPAGESDVLIGQDVGLAKARKVMDRLVAAEQLA
jgi:phenylpropionate dioxygenase-like ring-hydroxylating dioxygenase large terminal subunit